MLFSLVKYPGIELKSAKKSKTCYVCVHIIDRMYHMFSALFTLRERVP